MSSRAEPAGLGRTNDAGSLARAFGWVALGLVIQAALVPFLAVHGAMPSAVGIGVTLFALRRGPFTAGIFGLLTGALQDALSGGTGVAWTVATTGTAIAIALLARLMFVDGAVLCALAVAGAVFGRAVLFWTGMKITGYPSGLGLEHLHVAVISALESAVVAAVIVVLRERWSGAKR